MLKKFMAALLAVCLLLTTLPTAMLAGEGDGIGGETPAPITMTVKSISVNPNELYENSDHTALTMQYSLTITSTGDELLEGQQVSVNTNIGELFIADWNALSHLNVTGDNGQDYGYISITADKVTFTVGEDLTGGMAINSATITTGYDLQAKDFDLTSETPTCTKLLTVGTAQTEVTFKYRASTPSASDAPIDIDWFWKSAYASNTITLPADAEGNTTGSEITAGIGASINLEVNSLGSFHVYGKDRDGLEVFNPLFVKDKIQKNGVIDENSVNIFAIVPVLAVRDTPINHGNYTIPANTYYPQRQGSMWYKINDRISKVEQKNGETLEGYEERLRELQYGWGVYYDEDTNTQTFMCNFGKVGDPNDNNGIKYEDFAGMSRDYVRDYPDIFGDEGLTGGNIVSYHIDFQTYYPDLTELTQVDNKAQMTKDVTQSGYYDRTSDCWITQAHSASTGVAKKNEVIVKLVDEEDNTSPIAGAKFDVYEWDETKQDWVNVMLDGEPLSGTTDENGRIVFKNFLPRKYKLVQSTTAEGYQFSNNTFGSSGVSIMNDIDKNGEFTVKGNEEFGFGTVVTNRRGDTDVTYQFKSGTDGAEIPEEVLNYLPTDTNRYQLNSEIAPKQPEQTSVIGPKSDDDDIAGVWTFTGYDPSAATVTEDDLGKTITFTGTWTWKQAEAIKVEPADITIYMGGDAGFEGSVNDQGMIVSNGSLPEPGFRVTLPKELAGKDLTSLSFKDSGNSAKEWKFKSYDGKSNEIFKLEPTGSNTEKTRMQFKQADGTVVTSDQFDVSKAINQTLTMSLYKGEGDTAVGDVVVTDDDGLIYYVYSSATAELTVRGTTSAAKYADVQSTDDAIVKGEPGLVAADDTVYTINEGNVQAEKAGIALLFDEIIDTNDDDRLELLKDRADKELANSRGTRHYDIKYLDLVDRDNGNAWVKANKLVTIYWPLPDGTNKNTDFTLLHFEDLHREMNIDDVADEIEKCKVSDVLIKEVTDTHVIFEIGSGGFSPFALVWDEKNDHPHWPPVDPGDDDDDPSEDPDEPDTPDDLNTVDHFSYVVGYPEDYRTGEPTDNEDLWPVKPQSDITRAEVATIFYRLLKADVRDENTTDVSDFSDVSSSDWYGTTVATLAEMNIVEGYEDGTFRPNAPITRAEFAAIATRFFEKTGATYEPGTFTDVTGDEWFAGAIMDAVNLGLIGGYEDGTVRPNNNITRAEACAIVNRTLGRVPDADHLLPADEMKTWPDNPETAWYYADMQEATNGHEYEWITDDGSRVEDWTDLLDKEWNDR